MKKHRIGRSQKTRVQIRASAANARPEDVLFDWWTEARRKRDKARDPKTRQKFYAQADKLQDLLQGTSPLGHRMVWGTEYAKDRDEGYSPDELRPKKAPLFASRYGGRY